MPSPDPACRTFRKLARMNHLANRRLQAAGAQLSPEAFLEPRTGFFPSLALTLNHILVVDRLYIDALEGGRLGPAAFADPLPHPALSDLVREQAALDHRLLAFCDALAPDNLAREVRIHREDRVQVERCDDTLSHLFQHQTHHRGQAHAMLSGTAVPPPQLDEFLVADDAGLRAEDLGALGWTEADLMA